VDSHADGLLDALDADGLGGGRDPLVGLESQVVLGEEGASALLLKCAAIDLLRNGLFSSRRRSGLWGGCGRCSRPEWELLRASMCILGVALTQRSWLPSFSQRQVQA
jgi:hypothetical protein